MPFHSSIPAADLDHLTMSEEEARTLRYRRKRRLFTRTYAYLRVIGIGSTVVLAMADHFVKTGQIWDEGIAWFTGFVTLYLAIAWLGTVKFYNPDRSERIPQLFLLTDFGIAGLLIFMTDGLASPYFFFPYVRIVDQIFRGPKASTQLLACATLTHVGGVVTYGLVYGAPVPISGLLLQVVACLAPGFYFVMVSREVTRVYGRSRTTVSIARQLVNELQSTSERLEVASKKASAAAEAKGQFLANMSHELRTPMNGIIGMSELALSTGLAEEPAEYVGAVRDSAHSLLTIVNDILDLSRLEAGGFNVETAPFQLRESIRGALSATAPAAFAKGLDIACDIDPSIPEFVAGDGARLRQILINLVGNAVKFTATGHIRIVVQRGDGPNDVLFLIEDTGIGIAAQNLLKVFDVFAQAEETTARRFGGTGLGLPIARQLCEAMGGKLDVESALGEGTTFRMSIPLRASSKPMPTASKRTSREQADVSGVVHVLCYSTVVRDSVTRHVEQLGRTVEGHASASALERALGTSTGKRREPAVIVLLPPHGFKEQLEVEAAASALSGDHWIVVSQARPEDGWKSAALRQAKLTLAPVVGPELRRALRSLDETGSGAPPRARSEVALDWRSPAPLKVLLVEDNIINQKVAKQLLLKWGHKVTVAGDGQVAVDTHAAETFDVILMDMQMPVMDGLAATQAIREREAHRGGGARTPIIAMTANAGQVDQNRCLEAGMDDFVPKPIDIPELFEVLSRVQPRPNPLDQAA
ncbi:Sensor histidine kinase RcsC [Planctomycetes bacterium Poly30]|uniref:Sensory/regulatory protein RpfC n=1 Tax=Saltatorellus ferox TaxID=2528018 RepID=A0A518EZM3_9BACT|nr:Sensor histidine kinase RcsC [Planctomycetes bacterium Poly30]